MNEKINEMVTKVAQTANRAGFKIQKHSPEILLFAGIAGVVTSAVMACKATTKIEEAYAKTQEERDAYTWALEKFYEEDGSGMKQEIVLNEETGETCTLKEFKKAGLTIRAHWTLDIAKLYIPSVVVGAAGITCLLASHGILSNRNAAVAAAYAGLDKTFKEYRNRVADRFGEEVEKEIKYGAQQKKIEETVVDEEGKKKKVKNTIDVVDPSAYSEYARFYDDGCNGWTKNAEDNLCFLKAQQAYANQLLKLRGHVFLNEVYDMLGIPRTKAGQCVGWVYDDENQVGDNYIDFGIYNSNIETNRDFVNGYEKVILLDFNVDGNIMDLI